MKTRRPPRPRRVIIESPYAGDINRNIAYCEIAMLDSIMRGEAPFASHMLYPYVLRDDDPEERKLGISLGTAWLQVADLVAFYTDFGISPGMSARLSELKSLTYRIPYEIRKVNPDALNSILDPRSDPIHSIRHSPTL